MTRLVAELATAKTRITALESELASKQEALSRLLADNVRTCEQLAELQKMIWGYHRGLPGGCIPKRTNRLIQAPYAKHPSRT